MSQPIEGVSNLTITKLFFHATNHYACINCCPQSVSQPVGYAVSLSVSKSVSQSVNQSISQSVSQPTSQLGPVYMEWGIPVQWGRFLLFCVPQSVKTKETYPTRPGSPTPCKQGLSQSISQSVSQSVSQQVNDFGQKLQISFLFVLGKKQALRQCLTIIQLEKKSSQTIKILILNSGHIVFSQRGQPMILVEKWKFHLCMFLDKWTLKYCLTIIEVENKPSQTIKIWI